jgi:cellulose synthase/poly-beta-1,6-N-acetylglucosamine synthase-like glycosyltransferase
MKNNLSLFNFSFHGYAWPLALLLGFVVTLIAHVSHNVSFLLFILLLLLFLKDFKQAVPIYLFFLLISTDTELLIMDTDQILVAHSLFLDSFYGVTLFAGLNIFLLGIMGLKLLKNREKFCKIHPGIMVGRAYQILYVIPFCILVAYTQKAFIFYGVLVYFLNQALTAPATKEINLP